MCGTRKAMAEPVLSVLADHEEELASLIGTVAVGPDGSGARTTWDAFVLADTARYSVVGTDARSGVRALSAVAELSPIIPARTRRLSRATCSSACRR